MKKFIYQTSVGTRAKEARTRPSSSEWKLENSLGSGHSGGAQLVSIHKNVQYLKSLKNTKLKIVKQNEHFISISIFEGLYQSFGLGNGNKICKWNNVLESFEAIGPPCNLKQNFSFKTNKLKIKFNTSVPDAPNAPSFRTLRSDRARLRHHGMSRIVTKGRASIFLYH